MTEVMKQLLVFLRNAVKYNNSKDINLYNEILLRTIQDQPILKNNEEISEALKMVKEFYQQNQTNQ